MAEGFLGLARVFTRSHRPIHSQLLIGKETATTRNCENYQVKTGVAAGAPPKPSRQRSGTGIPWPLRLSVARLQLTTRSHPRWCLLAPHERDL